MTKANKSSYPVINFIFTLPLPLLANPIVFLTQLLPARVAHILT